MAGPVKKYDVNAVIAEARLKKPAIVLTGLPGDPDAEFRVDPPELWGDDIQNAAAAGRATDLVKLLLGDQYDAFRAAGGTNSMVNLVISAHAEASKATLGESSASSSS